MVGAVPAIERWSVMSHEGDAFDAMQAELDATLDSLIAGETTDAVSGADRVEAMRKLRVFSSIDLLHRRCRLNFKRSDIAVKEKYRIIADGLRQILSAWGDAPPQFAKFCVPEDVYEKLYPLYSKALYRATRPE